MKGFEEITVLDFTQAVAGPISTQLLGSLGAEIIKVEPPDGEPFRSVMNGAMFTAANHGGKQSIAVDLKTDDGKELVRELASEVDAIVESYRPGVLRKFDLDYDSVTTDNENVVYTSITGFGQDGPYADYPAYDPIAQAMSGLMSLTGYEDSPPVRVGASLIDYGTGTMAAFLTAAGLMNRELTGEGEYINVSLFETAISYMGYWIADYTGRGELPQRSAKSFAGLAPHGVFHDGNESPFYLSAYHDSSFEQLCRYLGREDIIEDGRYDTLEARFEHRDSLREKLSTEFKSHTRESLASDLAEFGIAIGPVLSLDAVVEDEHVRSQGLLTETFNPYLDTDAKTADAPFTTKSGRPSFETTPPAAGAHSRAVLRRLGYDETEIQRLLDDSVVVER